MPLYIDFKIIFLYFNFFVLFHKNHFNWKNAALSLNCWQVNKSFFVSAELCEENWKIDTISTVAAPYHFVSLYTLEVIVS